MNLAVLALAVSPVLSAPVALADSPSPSSEASEAVRPHIQELVEYGNLLVKFKGRAFVDQRNHSSMFKSMPNPDDYPRPKKQHPSHQEIMKQKIANVLIPGAIFSIVGGAIATIALTSDHHKSAGNNTSERRANAESVDHDLGDHNFYK